MTGKRRESPRLNWCVKSTNPVVPQTLTETAEDYWNSSRPKAGVAGSNPAGGHIAPGGESRVESGLLVCSVDRRAIPCVADAAHPRRIRLLGKPARQVTTLLVHPLTAEAGEYVGFVDELLALLP